MDGNERKTLVIHDITVLDDGMCYRLKLPENKPVRLELEQAGDKKPIGPFPSTVNRLEIKLDVTGADGARKTHKIIGQAELKSAKMLDDAPHWHYTSASIAQYEVEKHK